MNIIQTTFMGRGKIRPEWRKKQDELIRHRIKIFKQLIKPNRHRFLTLDMF